MQFSPRLQQLLQAFRRLPGVGGKTAQRLAFHVLEHDRDGARALAEALQAALRDVVRCSRCRMFAEAEVCGICSGPTRDSSTLCVVESPADVMAIEDSASFRGMYFVLHGRLSPLDGIGPAEIGAEQFASAIAAPAVREVILATSATVEGEATAAYLASLVREQGKRATRIAHGVPIGGELEYVDSSTLSRAIAGRVTVEQASRDRA
ncbi:MAG: recombination protein RecR [Gammaproteobacteria bacterium]|nr:MAG: recombination protein RecR [Pseudomonadota bacterium]MBC6945283.1 recombination protein RecR [Gammaproteobacteria bacterium]MCE7901072.1 recombination protein RecR [Gammaproteobacteria bacterium PRO9]MDL1880142.1 recombination protein RecR [Gammaproteobacteria bacterium PRO2]MCL4776236.1 recombination mediator RecR [Gammaproteobacteria bacterium]